jgi:hypothetical protein
MTLDDRDAAWQAVNALFLAVDRKDWAAARRMMAKTVRFDFGGGAEDRTPEQITDAWTQGLAKMEHVHHQLGNQVVSVRGNRATVFCYGVAYHYRKREDGRNTRTFVGSYDVELARDATEKTWTVDAFKFTLKFIDGNQQLDE